MIQKQLTTRGKNDKLDYIKIKNFCSSKDNIKSVKGKNRMGKDINNKGLMWQTRVHHPGPSSSKDPPLSCEERGNSQLAAVSSFRSTSAFEPRSYFFCGDLWAMIKALMTECVLRGVFPSNDKQGCGTGAQLFHPPWNSSNEQPLLQSSLLGSQRPSGLHCCLMVSPSMFNPAFFPFFSWVSLYNKPITFLMSTWSLLPRQLKSIQLTFIIYKRNH